MFSLVYFYQSYKYVQRHMVYCSASYFMYLVKLIIFYRSSILVFNINFKITFIKLVYYICYIKPVICSQYSDGSLFYFKYSVYRKIINLGKMCQFRNSTYLGFILFLLQSIVLLYYRTDVLMYWDVPYLWTEVKYRKWISMKMHYLKPKWIWNELLTWPCNV